MEKDTPGQALSIVPYPKEVALRGGELRLDQSTRLALPMNAGSDLRAAAERFAQQVRADWRIELPLLGGGGGGGGGNIIHLQIDPNTTRGSEAYRLSVDGRGATISAPSDAGLFYGLQTLLQLLPLPGAGARPVIPAVEIIDEPRFGYRGLHLDVGRHFFPVSFVKKYIDLMSRYKLNTFHWHLTEDQGWRIAIRRYPRLTSVGGCRKETMIAKNFNPYLGDNTTYCGFYTQDEVREIVEYAKQRFITVIPEIELPGHATAALAAYPDFSCSSFGTRIEVATRWGIFDDIFCPTEETFAFLENVLNEVMTLFPSRYIHIGGDEVPKKRWQESPVAQSVKQREALKDEHELQSYFIRRIEKILNAKGRRLIGWDEILEGGLAPDATVMSWRGMAGGIAAARQGHDVIMTPSSHLYFDHYQGDPSNEPLAIGGMSPLEKVYQFEPVPAELNETEARHVLGAQANVWTEYMPNSDHVEYMVFPRLLALAEVVWSPREQRSWEGFSARLPVQLARLDKYGVKYRKPF